MSNISTDGRRHPAPALEEHAADPIVEDVILATDGGLAGAGAEKWLARRAKAHRLDVVVDLVVEADWLAGAMLNADLTGAAENVVSNAKANLLLSAPSARVRTVVTWGNPRKRFEHASERTDLIVVGTNRAGRLADTTSAAFPVELAEIARCPVVIVPSCWKPDHGAIVVGIQGDDHDDPALMFAIHEARVLHRELRVVHCWQVPSLLSSEVMALTEISKMHASVLTRLVESVRFDNRDLDVRGVLIEGDPTAALAREAANEELLVVGSHGKTTVDRFFVGSTSRGVLAQSSCPVAVVRPKKR